MLTEYIRAATRRARYEILENDGDFYGEIPGFEGAWTNVASLEESREELEEALEGWIVLNLSNNLPLPTIDGLSLEISSKARCCLAILSGDGISVSRGLAVLGVGRTSAFPGTARFLGGRHPFISRLDSHFSRIGHAPAPFASLDIFSWAIWLLPRFLSWSHSFLLSNKDIINASF